MRLRRARDVGPPAPTQLSRYVAEPFYAPISPEFLPPSLGPRNNRGMSDEERLTLDTFDTLSDSLLAELRDRLQDLSSADPTSRREELEAFSAAQASRLAERERLAEQLRATFAEQHDWNRRRSWKLGRGRLDLPREQLRAFEFEVVRAAAYFQDGLLPAQRRLLRELAMELGEGLRFGEGGAASAPLFLSILPETSRMLLPASFPADLQAQVREFHQSKQVLKQELADALLEVDSLLFTSGRAKALEQFAPRQSARLLQLETDAEELRRTLSARAAFPRQRWPQPLAPELRAELDAYIEARRKLGAALDSFRLQQRQSARGGQRPNPQEVDAAFDAQNTAELDAWETQARELAPRLAAVLDPDTRAGMSNDPVRFIEDFEHLRERQRGMVECEIAILEPGLSPEQRRLLFSGAVAALGLPLPPGVPMPTRAPGTVVPPK